MPQAGTWTGKGERHCLPAQPCLCLAHWTHTGHTKDPLGGLLSVACCVSLTSRCPSLNLHSLAINWNNNPTLLHGVEGPVRQPEGVLARDLAWSAPCFSPALATHSFSVSLLFVSAWGPHPLCEWGPLRVGWGGHCQAAAAGGGWELTLCWLGKSTEGRQKGCPGASPPSPSTASVHP